MNDRKVGDYGKLEQASPNHAQRGQLLKGTGATHLSPPQPCRDAGLHQRSGDFAREQETQFG